MKFRSDFVTNSSSSSFIIGKKDENINVDFVYNLVLEFYKEFFDLREKFKGVCDEYGMKYVEVRGYDGKKHGKFEFKNAKIPSNIRCEMEEIVYKNFGIFVWEDFPTTSKLDWFDCKSYNEYYEFWKSRMLSGKELKRKNGSVRAPFSIVDYSERTFYYPIENVAGLESVGRENLASDLSWYLPCFYVYSRDKKINWGHLRECEYCCCQNRCAEVRNSFMQNKNKKGVVLDILGKICVCSYAGVMPHYVVDKLSEISNYSCEHMG